MRNGNALRRSSTPLWVRIVSIGALTISLTAISFALLCAGLEIPSVYRMAKHGAFANGRVTAKEPQNHGGLVVYSFELDSRTYSGRDGIGDAFETTKVGDRVSVIYDPSNPTMSALGKTEAKLWQTVAISIFVSLLVGILGATFLTFVWYHWRRNRS